MKKLGIIVLSCVMALSTLFISSIDSKMVSVRASVDVTDLTEDYINPEIEEGIVYPQAESIYSFINDSRWANGVSWGDDQRPKLSSWDCWACCAYCADYVKYCYGSDYPWSYGTAFYNKNDIQAGDVVQVTGHYFVVVERSGDSLYVAEGNYVWNCPARVMIDWRYKVSGINNFIQGWHYPVVTQTPPTPSPIPTGHPMEHGYDRVLPDGDYVIANAGTTNKNSLCYMCAAGTVYPAPNNTNVHVWNGIGYQDSDVWTITYSDGFYSIKQKGTEMYLDLVGTPENGKYLERGSNIQVYQEYEFTQRWAISRNTGSGNGYRIQAKCSGFSVDLSDGAIENGKNIRQWTENSSTAQSWMFIPYKPAQPIEQGRYILLSDLGKEWEMDVEGASADIPDSTNVQLWADSADSRYNSFDLVQQSNGYYKLINAASGKALTVQGGSSNFVTNIYVTTSYDTLAQEFAIISSERGWTLVSRCCGFACDVQDAVKANGTNIVSYPRNFSSAQGWHFVAAEYSVNYNANGGSGAPSVQTKYYKNKLTLSKTKPTRKGYTFQGWATTKTATKATYQAGGSYTKDSNVTLYAVWKANPTPTPTKAPTKSPTKAPTKAPTRAPTKTPTKVPTKAPTKKPTKAPTKAPTKVPTKTPTKAPTKKPTKTPTKVPTKAPTKKPTPTKAPVFSDFVERLYTCALNRKSEPEGKKYWTNEVTSGKRTGADCARYFLLEAPEFMNRNLSVEDFVETLYKTFFDRKSDSAGKTQWVYAIKTGQKTRAEVVNDFIESTEWCNICAKYSVKSGAKYHKATFASPKSIEFATRLYTSCLKRKADPDGVKYWSLALTNLEQTGCSAAKFFFTGNEFKGLKTSPEEYVRRLYTTFMGRKADEGEVTYWAGRIRNNEMTRLAVLKFFGSSDEFTKICAKYGIDRGSIA